MLGQAYTYETGCAIEQAEKCIKSLAEARVEYALAEAAYDAIIEQLKAQREMAVVPWAGTALREGKGAGHWGDNDAVAMMADLAVLERTQAERALLASIGHAVRVLDGARQRWRTAEREACDARTALLAILSPE